MKVDKRYATYELKTRVTMSGRHEIGWMRKVGYIPLAAHASAFC